MEDKIIQQKLTSNILLLKSLSDEDFLKKLDLLVCEPKSQVDDVVLVETFEYFGAKGEQHLLGFMSHMGLPSDRAQLLSRQFQKWAAERESVTDPQVCGREVIQDLQWKLVVGTSGGDERRHSTRVQIQLVVGSGPGALRPLHLEMGVDAFYDFLGKMEKGAGGIKGVLRS